MKSTFIIASLLIFFNTVSSLEKKSRKTYKKKFSKKHK